MKFQNDLSNSILIYRGGSIVSVRNCWSCQTCWRRRSSNNKPSGGR